MSETGNHEPTLLRKIVGAAIFSLILLTAAYFAKYQILEGLLHVAVLLSLSGPVIGAYVIWRLVQWVNQRDDPRHAKRPADRP